MPARRGQVVVDDKFWSPRRRTVQEITVPYQFEKLRTGGQFEALRLGWNPGDPNEPHIFWESDVAKWIEAASYVIERDYDAKLDERIDEAIALLANAQQPDGYLNVYFTVVRPGHRFTDLRDAHELYCAGHLIEAAVAHHIATGKRSLLDVVAKYVTLIEREFGAGGSAEGGYDGHEEIELALVKLYRVTGERRYLDLSARFINARGTQPFFFDDERERRGDEGWAGEHAAFRPRPQMPERYREYSQAHAPVREQRTVVGHAVRAMYLYTAMADLALELDDASLRTACERLWNDLVSSKLYVTGGIGSDRVLESFGSAYDLPNADAYAETCAAIGLVFWAQRMALLTGESRYVDVLERALYNGVLSGMSADGTHFFYQNPLASRGDVERSPWFGTACCPPNIARLLSSLEDYIYAVKDSALTVNLFVSGSVTIAVGAQAVGIRITTGYPWDGGVCVEFDADDAFELELRLRIPAWTDGQARIEINGRAWEASVEQGYAVIRKTWEPGDEVLLTLPMDPFRVHGDVQMRSTHSKVAIQRGPLVYCIEETDNAGPVAQLRIDRAARLRTIRRKDAVHVLADGFREISTDESLYSSADLASEPTQLNAVPYFSWANRGIGSMEVWIRE